MANSDNPRTGADFESAALAFFRDRGIGLHRNFAQPIGARSERQPHKFDLGCDDPPVLIECKCHAWTSGGNSPSAKLSVWNEAMYYFAVAPNHFRKILLVKHSVNDNQSLAQHYIARYAHLIPPGVEIVEFDAQACIAMVAFPDGGALLGSVAAA